jgi:hypothetical protein
MANSLLLDLTLFLVANNLATGDGVDVFRDYLPEKPDNLISLSEYKGDSVSTYDSNTNRSIQIMVRNTSADEARKLSLLIYRSLYTEGKTRIDFTTSRWGQVSLRQTPFKLGEDDNNRFSYIFNCGITTTVD